MIKIKNDGYYVYLHKDINTKTPIYVGKGCGLRAFDRESRNDQHKVGMAEEYYIDIIESGLEEEAALKLEDDLIRYIGRKDLGRGPLLNKAGGIKEGDFNDMPPVFEDKCDIIKEAIQHFKDNAQPFPYSVLMEKVDMDSRTFYDVIEKCNLKGEIARANEWIDKWLINDAFESLFGEEITDEQISEHTGVKLCDRFRRRIKEVRNDRT